MKWIKKFNEAQKRIYTGGNLFSNSHRFPNLPENCPMVDVDNLIIDENFEIVGILEDKFKFESKMLGNPISSEGTWQIKMLNKICNSINIKLYLSETSTNKLYLVSDDKTEEVDNKSISNFRILNTSDIIYLEIRNRMCKSLMFRTSGIKNLGQNLIFKSSQKLSSLIGVDTYLINDVLKDGLIYILKYGDSRYNYHIIKSDDPESWSDIYSKLKLM